MQRSASWRKTRRLAALLALGLVLAPARGRADDRSDARAHYDKATGAYALGHYADAAAEFEQAFTFKPDPAILYNAAQAYRLAGKKERALELYKNYRRVYGRHAEHAAEIDKHVAELEKAIENDRHASTAERTSLAPVETGTPVAMPAPQPAQPPAPMLPVAPAPAAAASATLVAQPAPQTADAERPIYGRWWFWAGAGAVVVAAAIVGIALATRKSADCGAGVDYCANTGL